MLSTLYRELVRGMRAQRQEANASESKQLSARHDYMVMLRAVLIDDLVRCQKQGCRSGGFSL